jgi:hypothetical protein
MRGYKMPNEFKNGSKEAQQMTKPISAFNEARVSRLIEVMAANIEAQLDSGDRDRFTLELKPKGAVKPDWKLERTLRRELSNAEQMEVTRRRKAKAAEAKKGGDSERQSLWADGWQQRGRR